MHLLSALSLLMYIFMTNAFPADRIWPPEGCDIVTKGPSWTNAKHLAELKSTLESAEKIIDPREWHPFIKFLKLQAACIDPDSDYHSGVFLAHYGVVDPVTGEVYACKIAWNVETAGPQAKIRVLKCWGLLQTTKHITSTTTQKPSTTTPTPLTTAPTPSTTTQTPSTTTTITPTSSTTTPSSTTPTTTTQTPSTTKTTKPTPSTTTPAPSTTTITPASSTPEPCLFSEDDVLTGDW